MSDSEIPCETRENLSLPDLSAELLEALSQSAHRNGRTVHEEAEHIIKTHLAASLEDEA